MKTLFISVLIPCDFVQENSKDAVDLLKETMKTSAALHNKRRRMETTRKLVHIWLVRAYGATQIHFTKSGVLARGENRAVSFYGDTSKGE